MDYSEIISNVKVYGLEESIKRAKYPMSTDVGKLNSDLENLNYWKSFNDFIPKFSNYQSNYNKDKGKNTKESCSFCGSHDNVHFVSKNQKYYCSKCCHQIDRYGEVFETTPEFILMDDFVEVICVGEKRQKSSFLISYQSLPFVFSIKDKLNFGIKNDYKKSIHRLIYENFYGNIDSALVIDHINHNIEDNRLSNLRVANKSENAFNCKLSKNNTSSVIGVSFRADKNKWRAYINLKEKQVNLGLYVNFDDAVKARLIGEKIYCKEFSPQRHLFEQYGIEDDLPTNNFVENSHGLKEVLKNYRCVRSLARTKSGCGEDQWLTGVIVQFDLTFTVKAWTEAQRYHFLDFVSSQSTMHRITRFNLDNQYVKYVDQRIVDIMKEKIRDYNDLCNALIPQSCDEVEAYEKLKKEKYLEILYSNPCGFKLTAGMTTNYRQLKTIYAQRKNHRLPEWRAFCEWIKTLPNSELIMCETKEENN